MSVVFYHNICSDHFSHIVIGIVIVIVIVIGIVIVDIVVIIVFVICLLWYLREFCGRIIFARKCW